MFAPVCVFILFSASSLSVYAAAEDEWQRWQAQASSKYEAGDYAAAESALRNAIARAERADNGGAYKASSLNMLAFVQAAQGDQAGALNSMADAVRLGEETLGRPHEQVAALLFNQGLLLQQDGQADKASVVLQQAIGDYQALNSTGGSNLWQAVLSRSALLAEQAPADAVAEIQQALSGFANSTGFSQQPAGADLIELELMKGRIEYGQQAYQQAVTSLEQAWQLAKQGTDAAVRLSILELLADTYQQLGRSGDALALRQQSLTLLSGQAPSPALLMQLNELAMEHQHKQEYAQAATLYEQALETVTLLGMSGSMEHALVLANAASLKLAQKDNNAALAMFEQSVQLHQTLDARPIEASRAAGYLGSIYYERRQYDKAEPAFLQALAWLDSTADAAPESVLIALENLSALYVSWGRANRAQGYERRIIELRQALR